MCELMGLSFSKPICADFSLREFSGRGDTNADGWGLGWYPDRSVAVVKEPIRWGASGMTQFLESYKGLVASLYIAHVRHKTVGGTPTHADTQPFTRELRGVEYCFTHNGTIHGHASLSLGRFRPLGETDSEHLFCHLLDAIEMRGRELTAEDDWRWLHAKLAELNARGTMNCMFADGRRLFCYFDKTGHKGLTYRNVYVQNQRSRSFGDDEVHLDLRANSFNHGFVLASQPLSVKGWHALQPGEFMVLDAGCLRFSSHRASAPPGNGHITAPATAEARDTTLLVS
jgi:glutamine amidotransferase